MDISAPTCEINILEKDISAEETVIAAFKCKNSGNESCREYIEWEQPSIEEFIVPHEEQQADIVPAGELLAAKKRKKSPSLWKTTLRRQKRESGQMYISTKNKVVPGRALKKPCSNCIFNCTNIFSVEERTQIFHSFWSLSDDEKNDFYNKFVTRNCVKRRKKDCDNSIKQFSYKYFFEKNQSLRRVCRVFFLNTLCIDQKRIYYSFTHMKNKDISSNPKAKLVPAIDKTAEIQEPLSCSSAISSQCSREIVPSAIKIVLPRKRKKNLTCKSHLKRSRIEMGRVFIPTENEVESDRNGKESTPIKRRKFSTLKAHLQRPKIEIGEACISTKQELEHGKDLKEPCDNCFLQCTNVFTSEERTKIFQLFWSLTDEEKNSFYDTFVRRDYVKCRRTNSRSSTKQYSYKYFFEKNQSLHRVCRVFFLNTLSINQKKIYYYFKYLRNQKCSALQGRRKKMVKLAAVPDIKLEIPEQIFSTPDVGSQYCRAIVPSANEPLLTRKRKVNTSLWKISLCKVKREPEQTYVSMKREIVPGKALRKPCSSCPYSCTNVFSAEERINVFQSFWSLSGDEKISFYKKFVIRDTVKRRKKGSQSDIKQFSYKYFLEKNQALYRVCRVFFLNTLCIDQKRIYYSFKHLQNKCARSTLQRRNVTTVERITAPEKTVKIEEHVIDISAFRSDYCSANVPPNCESLPVIESNKDPLLCKTTLREPKTEDDAGGYIRESIQKPMCESEQPIGAAKSNLVACGDIKEELQKQNGDPERKGIKERIQRENSRAVQPSGPPKSKIVDCSDIKDIIQKENSETGQIIESVTTQIGNCEGIKERITKSSHRSIKAPCKNCPFDCANIFTTDDRLHIFQSFWSLSGEGKTCFYNKFVIRDNVKRRKKDSQSDIKQFSYKYFLEKNQCFYRVCRVFFLNTLSIDQKRIYYSFNHITNKDADPLV